MWGKSALCSSGSDTHHEALRGFAGRAITVLAVLQEFLRLHQILHDVLVAVERSSPAHSVDALEGLARFGLPERLVFVAVADEGPDPANELVGPLGVDLPT